MVAIPLLLTFVFFTSYALDVSFGEEENAWGLLGTVLFRPDLGQARSSLDDFGKIMSAILALVLTISSIVLQLASNRFTPHITSLFFRDRVIVCVINFMVAGSVFVCWANYVSGPTFHPRAFAVLALVWVTCSFLLLYPYFAYLFDFLDPHAFVRQITSDALHYAMRAKNVKSSATVFFLRKQTIEGIERLTDIGYNALRQRDNNIGTDVIDALQVFCVLYGNVKPYLHDTWFELDDWIRQTPDFISLSRHAVNDLIERKSWLEWKILRQGQAIFLESMTASKDMCYVVAINTRRLGDSAARRGDVPVLDLAIKFFNTYLRASINAADIRTAYNILHQYRQLGEALVKITMIKRQDGGEENEDIVDVLEQRVRKVARFFRYYALLCVQKPSLAFIADIMAYDLGTMTTIAFYLDSPCHDDLMHVFLTINDSEDGDVQASRGMRFAQIKLATTYLQFDEYDSARKVQADMLAEDPRRLLSLWNELRNVDQREFWEVNDRGTNFNYLAPSQKAQLPCFFGFFDKLRPLALQALRKEGNFSPAEYLRKIQESDDRLTQAARKNALMRESQSSVNLLNGLKEGLNEAEAEDAAKAAGDAAPGGAAGDDGARDDGSDAESSSGGGGGDGPDPQPAPPRLEPIHSPHMRDQSPQRVRFNSALPSISTQGTRLGYNQNNDSTGMMTNPELGNSGPLLMRRPVAMSLADTTAYSAARRDEEAAASAGPRQRPLSSSRRTGRTPTFAVSREPVEEE